MSNELYAMSWLALTMDGIWSLKPLLLLYKQHDKDQKQLDSRS